MPYYSYGYGYDSANLIYLILLVPVLLLSLYAQAAVSGNFLRYSKVTNRRGLTGAQAAAGVLRAHGITDVGIARCSGKLTDHYDPRNNTIFLSDSVYDAATVAAVGVAAHEAGHAVQYAVGYGPVKLRSAIVKTTQFSSQASFIILMLGLVLGAIVSVFADRHYTRFETQAVWWAQILKVVLGLALTLAVRVALKAPLTAAFGANSVGDGIRYFAVVLMAGTLWPMTFGWFSLMGRKK